MPSIQEIRLLRSQPYIEFVTSHTFSNIQTVDTLAAYYYENMDKMAFANPNHVYAKLVDGKFIDQDPNILNTVQNIVSNTQQTYQCNSTYSVSQRDHFVDISTSVNIKDSTYSSCKLWLNIKHENYPFFTQEIMKHLAASSKNADTPNPTQFKICSDAERNDSISIYTDYEHAGPLIQMLSQLKRAYPGLFTPAVQNNPLICTVDNVVSFADVQHNVSYPKKMANLLCRVEARKEEILASDPKLRRLKTKKVLLETMLEDAQQLKYNPDYSKTYFINPLNLSSTRSSKGLPYQDLGADEIEEEIQNIQKCIAEVNAEAKKTNNKRFGLSTLGL